MLLVARDMLKCRSLVSRAVRNASLHRCEAQSCLRNIGQTSLLHRFCSSSVCSSSVCSFIVSSSVRWDVVCSLLVCLFVVSSLSVRLFVGMLFARHQSVCSLSVRFCRSFTTLSFVRSHYCRSFVRSQVCCSFTLLSFVRSFTILPFIRKFAVRSQVCHTQCHSFAHPCASCTVVPGGIARYGSPATKKRRKAA